MPLRYDRELHLLSKQYVIDSGDLDKALPLITQTIARSLGVARASVWTYNRDHSAINCMNLFEADKGVHSQGAELKAQDFPAYFKFLLEERTLPAHDALTDPATHEFAKSYLQPLGISSLLDAPLRMCGIMIGVICAEHIGPSRKWTDIDQAFMGHMSDIVARAFVAHERAESQRALEKLLRERSEELELFKSRNLHTARFVSLGEMAGGIAHEINTPLNVILLAGEQLEAQLNYPNPDMKAIKKATGIINDTCVRIAKIVRGLRTFARDGATTDWEHADLRGIITQVLDLCQQKLKHSSAQLEFQELADQPADQSSTIRFKL